MREKIQKILIRFVVVSISCAHILDGMNFENNLFITSQLFINPAELQSASNQKQHNVQCFHKTQ